MTAFETARLRLRKMTTEDAPFILELLNDPDWLRFIGDRQVHDVAAAEQFIENRLLPAYASPGMGFLLVESLQHGESMGISGLVDRDGLDGIDIGFGLLPVYRGHGYSYEAASLVIEHARSAMRLERLLAITAQDNVASQGLLRKLGLQCSGLVTLPGDDEQLFLFAVDFPAAATGARPAEF